MNKILIGSQYFFSCYDDFQGKDIDEQRDRAYKSYKNSRRVSDYGN